MLEICFSSINIKEEKFPNFHYFSQKTVHFHSIIKVYAKEFTISSLKKKRELRMVKNCLTIYTKQQAATDRW